VRPGHPPYFVGARQRTIPDSRLWGADRIVAMEARRAVRRQAFGLRRQPERARRALVRRVRRRSCNIEQQWRGQGAAAALEYVDGEACSRERKSDAQRRGRRLRGARGRHEKKRQRLTFLRRQLQPPGALISPGLRPEQERPRAIRAQYLLGRPP